ncbi:ABC transporter ATP-binding protein [Dactylosporangium sp. CA-233914]|uniref:ABC transporter ATP-binding protein n=1 Tax=Dactylosporangium sp. CA-233914 TaxID=3239934 RepID=UPI003D9015EC
MNEPVLSVRDLSTSFLTPYGPVTAGHGVAFDVAPGEIVGIVGESGCGKSVLAMSLMRLHPERTTAYAGSIRLNGVELLGLGEEEMRRIRGSVISMIFQDPQSSLNPLTRVGAQLDEVSLLHTDMDKAGARRRSIELLESVGIPDAEGCVHKYPHQLSGGMRQRVMIAMALACNPLLLIADEPTTALDVRVQAQILDVLRKLNESRGTAIVFISHDLAIVSELCSRVLVMYLGEVVEDASARDLFTEPLHPYTRGLIAALPDLQTDPSQDLFSVPGTVPTLDRIPRGCRFSTRCSFVTERCRVESPDLVERGGHAVRCWNVDAVVGGESDELQEVVRG